MPGASPGSMFRSPIAYYPPGTFLRSRLQARAVRACPPDPVPARTSVGQANQTVDVAAIAVGGGPQGSTTQVCGRFKLQRGDAQHNLDSQTLNRGLSESCLYQSRSSGRTAIEG